MKCNFIIIAVFCFSGLIAVSQNATDSLKKLLTGRSDTTQVEVLNELSWELCGTDNTAAIDYARQSIVLAEKLNYQKGLATAFNYLGVVYQNNGFYDSSIFYLGNALGIFEKLNLPNNVAGCLNNIGITYLYQSNWDKALAVFYQALEVKQRLNDRPGLVSVYNNIGIIYANLQNNDKALEYYLKSIGATDQNTAPQSLANTLNNVGLIYQAKQEYDSAAGYFNKAFATCEKTGNKKGIAATLHNLGSLLFEQDKASEAIVYYQKALVINQQLDDLFAVASLYNNMATMFQKSKDFTKSLEYYNKALHQSRQIGSKNQTVNALEGLAKTYELTGDFSNSLKFYKAFKQAQDSAFSAESEKYISELREKYEAGQREQKIKQLHAEASLQDFKIQSQKTWLMVSIFGLVLVIGFSIIMLVQRNQKHRAYQDLLRKNIENIRIEKQNEKLDMAEPTENSFEIIGPQTADIETTPEKYKTSALEQFQKNIIHDRIKFVMEQRKLFLQPDLTIEKLAIEIKTNKSYISQVINETENQNFSSFLNDYRIREARRLLIDPEHRNLTIETIARMVGFNSKSAFNNAFKKFTGLTPSFFIKNTPPSPEGLG